MNITQTFIILITYYIIINCIYCEKEIDTKDVIRKKKYKNQEREYCPIGV